MSPAEATSETGVYISEELLINILKRLPVKSLLRFISVCPSWYTLIKNPHFISTHLSHQIAIAKKNGSSNQSEPEYLLYLENDLLSRLFAQAVAVGTGENIAYIHKNRQTLNLWVMEINGVKESWRLVVSLRREDVGLKSIMNACKNGEILVELEYGSLAALNPTDLHLKVVSDKYRSMVYLGSYMETLVLFYSNPCLKPSNDLKQKSEYVQLRATKASY